jgi:uncharacterized protein (TIGR02246 family)
MANNLDCDAHRDWLDTSASFFVVSRTRDDQLSRAKEGRMMNPLRRIRHSAIFVLSAIAYACCAAAQTSPTNVSSQPQTSAEREIRSMEEERNQAILRGDVAALARMTSDDYTFITVRGELRTKSDVLKGFASRSFHYESRQISDLKVRVYGDTAIVTGRSTQQGMENGKDYSGAYWFTRVYVKEKGRWLTVALQTTLIQQ